MKKLGLLLIIPTLLLTGCSSTTSQGGKESLTNKITTTDYQISENVKSQINKGDQVIITEIVTGVGNSGVYQSTATLTANFIHSANSKMKEHGYKIVSTDTNGMGPEGAIVFVTLVFEKENK